MRRLFIAILFTAAAAHAQQRFSNTALNFSMETPDANWQWAPMNELTRDTSGGGVWMVRNPNGEHFSVSASQKGMFKIDENWMHEFMRALTEDGGRNGYRIEGFHYQKATAPIYPSYSYSYARVERDGSKVYVEGYVAALNRIYTMQYPSTNHALKQEFQKFVESFAVVDKFDTLRNGSASTGTAVFPGMPAIGLESSLGRPIAPNGVPSEGH